MERLLEAALAAERATLACDLTAPALEGNFTAVDVGLPVCGQVDWTVSALTEQGERVCLLPRDLVALIPAEGRERTTRHLDGTLQDASRSIASH